MSRTEREALEAGGTWWDAELFSGRPRWRRLLDLPPAHLSGEEQAFLDGPIDQLCRLLDDWRITHSDRDLPPEAWALIRRERLFGLVIPKTYGGLGFSHYAHSQAVMRLASRSIAAAVTVMVPNSLGPAELLLRYGTEAQRARYLPRLATGEEIPCFALTGPQAGSDAAATPDIGVVCKGTFEGQAVLGIRLDFEKRYITLAPIATLIGLAFRLRDPDRLLGDDPEPGITLALIPARTPGIDQGRRHLPLDIPFHNGPLSGRGVFIPLDWVIGGREGVGRGWTMLMECLAEGRGISLPALATGAGKLAARYTGAYARIRRQFGRSHRGLRGGGGAARPDRWADLPDGRRPPGLPGRASGRRAPGGPVRGAQVPPDRALSPGDQRRHGHPGGQRHLPGSVQPDRAGLPGDPHRHHGGGGQHTHPQPHRLRPGGAALPSPCPGRAGRRP